MSRTNCTIALTCALSLWVFSPSAYADVGCGDSLLFTINNISCGDSPPFTIDNTARVPYPEDSLGVACADDSECDVTNEARCVGGVCYAPKQRYISIARNPEQVANTGRRVMLEDGYCQDDDNLACVTEQDCVDAGAVGPCMPQNRYLGWVDDPANHPSTGGGEYYANLVGAPVYVSQWPDVIHVEGCAISHANLSNVTEQHCGPNGPPGGEIAVHHCYVVQAISATGDVGDEDDYSGALILCTNTTWGDTVSTCQGDVCLPPDGVPGLADIMGAIKLFQGTPVAPITWLDVAPSGGSDTPDQNVGLADIMAAIGGFQGDQYPGDGPLGCP